MIPVDIKKMIENIVRILILKYTPEKIILFGSYARCTYKEKKDLKPQQKTGHISDYDILVITEKKKTTDEFVSWNSSSTMTG